MKTLDAFFLTIVALVLTLTGVLFYSYKYLDYFENNPELKAQYERKKNLLSLQKKLSKLAQFEKLSSRQIASTVETPEETAKKYFHEAKVKCYEVNKEIDCLHAIELGITHFPESNWTGESLVLLTEFYYRSKRAIQARDILMILKKDFKKDESIQQKVELIERHLF